MFLEDIYNYNIIKLSCFLIFLKKRFKLFWIVYVSVKILYIYNCEYLNVFF